MKKKKNRFLADSLVPSAAWRMLAMVAFLLTSTVQQALAQGGKAGENVTWTLSGGCLTISGTEQMYDYSEDVPGWYQYHDFISTVVISDGVTNVGAGAFYSGVNAYKSLHSVYIGNTVSSIGDLAFNGLTQLKRISISEPATDVAAITIGFGAFTGCVAVTDIFCGAPAFQTWESADEDFKNPVLHVKSGDQPGWSSKWGGKSRVTIQGDLNDYTGYDMAEPIVASWNSDQKKLTISMEVKELPNNAARTIVVMKDHIDDVKKIEFDMKGVTLTAIGDEAFKEMKNLETIYLPSTVEYIGYEAFCDCEKLSDINVYPSEKVLPESLVTIGGRAFSGCAALSSLAVKANVDHIGYMAFSSCSNLTAVRFYGDEGEICFAPFVFADCSSFNHFNFSGSTTKTLKVIPEGMFSNCTELVSFTCPDDVETIGEAAFEGCTSLRYVKLNNKLKTIDVKAFLNCSSLTSDNTTSSALTIPASVETIGSVEWQSLTRGAFTGCTAIRELNLKADPTKLQWYGYVHDFDGEQTLACHVDNASDLLAWGKNYSNKLNATFDLTLSTVMPGDATCWSTFYCPAIEDDDRLALSVRNYNGESLNFTPDIYVAKVENNNVMLKNTGSIYIPQGQAVILHGASDDLNSQSVDPSFILTYTDGSSGLSEGDTSGNELQGSTTAVEQDGSYTYYALGKSGTSVKFRRVASTVSIPAYKAYLKLPAAAASASELALDASGTSGISAPLSTSSSSDWFTLDGRLLNGKPTSKGIYINNGHQQIVK